MAEAEDPRARWDFEPPRMKVLVTGGAGFIGSTLVPMLIREGYSVIIYDLFRWGMRPLLNSYLDTRYLEIIKGDILDDITVQAIVKSCDAVIHLAGIVSAPAFNRYPEVAQEINERGMQILVDSLKPEQCILFASVDNVYGRKDECSEPHSEDAECNPLTPFAEIFVKNEGVVLKSNGVVLRVPGAFGVSPRMRLDLLVNNLVYKACTFGHLNLYQADYKRNFIHIQDLASAFIFALKNKEQMRGQIYNIGDDSLMHSKREIYELIKEKIPNLTLAQPDDGAYADGDNRNFQLSFRKVQNLGFKTTRSLRDGIAELLKIIPFLSEAEVKKCQAL